MGRYCIFVLHVWKMHFQVIIIREYEELTYCRFIKLLTCSCHKATDLLVSLMTEHKPKYIAG